MQKNKNFLYLFFAGAILIILILGYTSTISNDIKENAIREWAEKEELIASDTAKDIEYFINDLFVDLNQTSNHHATVDGSYEELYEHLERLSNRFGGAINDIYKLDKYGVVEIRYPYKEGKIGSDYSSRPDVIEFLKNKEPMISDVIKTHSGKSAFTLNFPVYHDGEYSGIIRTTIYLSSLNKLFLEDIKFGQTGYAVLFDDKNIFWYHPIPSKIGEQMNLSFKSEDYSYTTLDANTTVMNAIRDRLKSGRYSADYGTYVLNNIGAFEEVLVHGLDLGVIISSNEGDAYLSISNHLSKIWRITLYLILMVALMAVLINYNMTQSLRLEVVKKTHQLEVEKVSVEKKVVERTKELVNEKHKVQILLDAKNDFINQMSHDIRTPMTPILSLLKLTVDETTNPLQKKDLEICLKNAHYLKHLIDDTLNLAKLEGGNIEFNFEKTSLRDVINEVIENNAELIKKYDVKADLDVSDKVFVKGDALRLQEVILNIHTNAIKFMPKGGTIKYTSKMSDDFVEVLIHDDGIGMTHEQINNAFKQFYKADVSRHEIGSTGLGLNICQRIVTKHGGKIWATSRGSNKGTTIHFTLKKY